MKRNLIITTSIILIVILLVAPFLTIYYTDKSYTQGFINSYIKYKQKIPNKDIKYKKVYFNWTDMGHWQAKARVYEDGKYYDYCYDMPNKHFVIVSATNSSNKLSVNVNKLKYGKNTDK